MTASSIEFSGAEGNLLAGDIRGSYGQPVIFLHGGGQTRRAWDATARKVADAGMRAITIDLRGHGESEWVASRNYTFKDYGADVAVIVQQTAERFHTKPSIVGASLGGLSSLIAQTDDSNLLDTLVLVDITPRMDIEGVNKILGFMGERMEAGFSTLEDAAEAIARYLPNRKKPTSLEGLRKNLRLCDDGRYRWHWDPAFMTSDRNINFQAREIMEGLIASLPELTLPVLLVRGMQSELVLEDYAKEFVSLAPSASYVDVGGAGHMVAGDKNDVFCNAILDFLTDKKAA